MVLFIEGLSADFFTVFWDFIVRGDYKTRYRIDGSPELFRFLDPGNPEFPAMLELFSRDDALVEAFANEHISKDISKHRTDVIRLATQLDPATAYPLVSENVRADLREFVTLLNTNIGELRSLKLPTRTPGEIENILNVVFELGL